MTNKMINLDWTFFSNADDARKAITNLQNEDDIKGDESADLIDAFDTDFSSFEKDNDLKWDQESPLMIKWTVTIDASKDIADVVIDNKYSVMKNWEENQSAPMDDEAPYHYTINEEIINSIREVLIEEYQKEIPFDFNEIFTVFVDNETEFGFEVYQLNATDTDGEVHIIDAATAVESGVFDKIKSGLQNRVTIKTVE